MNRDHVLECGCYADAIPTDNRMYWTRWPNAYGGSVLVNDHVSAEILKLGTVRVDGVEGTVSRAQDDCPHQINLWFDGRWTEPHPTPITRQQDATLWR